MGILYWSTRFTSTHKGGSDAVSGSWLLQLCGEWSRRWKILSISLLFPFLSSLSFLPSSFYHFALDFKTLRILIGVQAADALQDRGLQREELSMPKVCFLLLPPQVITVLSQLCVCFLRSSIHVILDGFCIISSDTSGDPFTDRFNCYRWHFHICTVKPTFSSLGSKSVSDERALCQCYNWTGLLCSCTPEDWMNQWANIY